jgi:hypothetical protein
MNLFRKYCSGVFFALFLLVTLTPSKVSAQVITAKAVLDSTSSLLGDHLKLDVLIEKPADIEADLPDPRIIFPENFEIINVQVDTVINEDRQTINQKITFAVFDTGYIDIPPLPVVFRNGSVEDTIKTLPLHLEIKSLPLDADIRDIRGNYPAPVTFAELWPYITAALAISAFIGFIIWYYRGKYGKMPAVTRELPAEPPEVTALAALAALKKEEPWLHNRIKHYHVTLTEILRIFVERKYGIMALEQTSDEILNSLEKAGCDKEAVDILESILLVADLVKFAKLAPDDAENAIQIDHAEDFINKTTITAVQDTLKISETTVNHINVPGNE